MTLLVVLWLSATGQLIVPPTMDEAERQRQAKVLLDEALRRYNAAEYEAAIESFKAAYGLAPAPGLLFNIAQAYRLAGKGHCQDAARTYRSYLDASPQASNRSKVETHLKSLETCVRDEERSAGADLRTPQPTAADAPTVARVEDPVKPVASAQPGVGEDPAPVGVVVAPAPQRTRWPAVVLGFGGAAVLGVGAGLYGWSGQEYVTFQNQCANGDCPPERWAPARTHEQVGITMLCVGAGAILGAAIWWLIVTGAGS